MGPPTAATVHPRPSELVPEGSDDGKATTGPGPEPSGAEVGRAPVTLGSDQPLVSARGNEDQGPATFADQVPSPKDASSRATETQSRPESVTASAPAESAPDVQDRDTSSRPPEAPPVVREAVRSSAERPREDHTATETRKPDRGTTGAESRLSAAAMEPARPQETPPPATAEVPPKTQDERLRGSEAAPEAAQGRLANSGSREPEVVPVPAGVSDEAREAPARPPVKSLAETADELPSSGPVAGAASEQGSEEIAADSETPGSTEEPARKERGRPSRRRRGGARNRRRTAAAQSTQPNGGEAPEGVPPGKPASSPSAAGGKSGALDNGERPGPVAEAGGGSPQKPQASAGSLGPEGSGFDGPATARTESAHVGAKDNAAG